MNILTAFKNKIKQMFGTSTDEVTYKEHVISKKEKKLRINTFDIPEDRLNILVMDDSEDNADITIEDLQELIELSAALRNGIESLNQADKDFISTLSNSQMTNLHTLSLFNPNIIKATGDMAAFEVLYSLRSCKSIIHFAILDIIIGGMNQIDGKTKILDGIDVAKEIMERGGTALFYSGCSVDIDSSESKKTRQLLHEDIQNMIIEKTSSFEDKKKIILKSLNFFMHSNLKGCLNENSGRK
jgi:CheY-like chemotaxis protein